MIATHCVKTDMAVPHVVVPGDGLPIVPFPFDDINGFAGTSRDLEELANNLERKKEAVTPAEKALLLERKKAFLIARGEEPELVEFPGKPTTT